MGHCLLKLAINSPLLGAPRGSLSEIPRVNVLRDGTRD